MSIGRNTVLAILLFAASHCTADNYAPPSARLFTHRDGQIGLSVTPVYQRKDRTWPVAAAGTFFFVDKRTGKERVHHKIALKGFPDRALISLGWQAVTVRSVVQHP